MPLFGYDWRTLLRMRRMSRRLANRDAYDDSEPFDWDWDVRREEYARYDALYNNRIYGDQIDGGHREEILQSVIGRQDYSLAKLGTYYNPTEAICNAYQNVFRGTWGKDFWPMNADGDDLDPAQKNPKGLSESLKLLWRSSNLNTQKQVLQTYGPLYGTVGVRIVATPPDGRRSARVRLQIDNPKDIVDFTEDGQGNITDILIRRVELVGELGEGRSDVEIEERFTRDRIIVKAGDNVLVDMPNELGVCPYVLIRHRDIGKEFGVPAFYGSENLIHWINWRITRQDQSIDRDQFPVWLATGSGDAPEEFPFDGTRIAYVKTDSNDVPPPTLNPLSPNTPHQECRAFWAALIENLKERQPELRLLDVKSLSGQSGETISQLLLPAKERIELARSNYEDGVIRAKKIGLSWMIIFKMADLGTGVGTVEAADRAYQSGAEDFTFNVRPALPQSPYELVQQHQADTERRRRDIEAANAAEFVSDRERLRMVQYDDEQIAEIEGEISENDVIPTDDGGDAAALAGFGGRFGENGNGNGNRFAQSEVIGDAAETEQLNGAQIQAAVGVVEQLRKDVIGPTSAVELLVAVGINRIIANKIVDETLAKGPIEMDENGNPL